MGENKALGIDRHIQLEVERNSSARDALDRLVAEFETMHKKLTAKVPEAG